jgi:CRISPR-associated protein Cmr6
MRHPIVKLREHRDRGQHPGLILARYLAEQNDEGRDKRALLTAACAAGRDQSMIALYRRAFERWCDGLSGVKAEADLRTRAHTRLIVGLGAKGVIEAGLRLHHTYGVPLIPGSALKGLAAHYCHEVFGAADKQYQRGQGYHNLLFGKTDDGGVIRFEDAWMHPDSLGPRDQGLLADVMTPHHQKWQTDENVVPTDFDNPVPVPFVSVAGCFHVTVYWQGPEHPQAEAWTNRAMEVLREALAEWGVGGKTSSGYGRLVDAKTEGRVSPPQPSAPPPADRPSTTPVSPLSQLKPQQLVDAILVEDPKGKGRRFAQHVASGLVGPILNPDAVPAEQKVDDKVSLVVASISSDNKQIQFRWPMGEQPKGKKPEQGPSRGGPGRPPPRRR